MQALLYFLAQTLRGDFSDEGGCPGDDGREGCVLFAAQASKLGLKFRKA